MKISIILASDSDGWIWRNNNLAWNIPLDIKYFKDTTSNTKDLAKHNAVIMWRKTWESIPSKFRPLKNRINCILSRTLKVESKESKINDFTLYFNSIDSCLEELRNKDNLENIFIIWWASLYNQILKYDKLSKIYLTKVFWSYDCDVFFDWIPDNFQMTSESELKQDNWIEFKFQIWERRKD